MGERGDIWQGTLALMIPKTIELMGLQHGYGIARRIEQTSGDKLTCARRKQRDKDARDWERATAILDRFLSPEGEQA
jgi:PadR family transcriptional regulator, regulatory protein PadR